MKSDASRREATLPAAALLDLIDDARAADEDSLREKGRAAGRLLAERLAPAQDGPAAARDLPAELFWKRVGELFASRGWGTLEHGGTTGPGLAELRSSDWIEADRPSGAGRCAFTAGVIEGLLERVSGARLEVEEIECRATGSRSCRFLFGSAAALAPARAGAAVATGS